MTKYSGIWPVAPTPFNDDGTVDYEGMKRVIDCMVDQGSDGICILANFSEQFLITDEERRLLTEVSLKHMAGRLPVIVTISHYATQIAVARAQHAKDHGAAMVMMIPPYHGALLKGSAEQSFEQFAQVGEVGIPIMVQDAPLSGVDLPVPLLVRMAREIEEVRLFKIECPQAATKLRDLIAAEAITLLADLEAGATGAMTSAIIPDQIKPVIDHFAAGDLRAATDAYARVLPAVNHENRQCGFRSAKAAMVEGGVIRSEFCRHPIAPLHPQTRESLLRLIRPLEPVVLSWGK